MAPYPHAATDTDFSDLRPSDSKPTYIDPARPAQPEEMTEINWRGLAICFGVFAAAVMVVVTLAVYCASTLGKV